MLQWEPSANQQAQDMMEEDHFIGGEMTARTHVSAAVRIMRLMFERMGRVHTAGQQKSLVHC